MKKFLALALCAAMALSVTACSGNSSTASTASTAASGSASTATKALKVGVSAPDLTNVFFIQIKQAMEKSLKKGDTLVIQDAGGDQNKQMNDVADMISQGCNVICLSSINSEGVKATLEACKEAGVPVIAFNTAVKNPELVKCTVVSDNVEAGKMCADALAAALNGTGKVVEITYSTTEVCYNRQSGFEQQIKAKYPNIQIIQSKDVEKPKSDYSQPIMVDFLNAHSDISGVFTINDPTARGAIAAIKEAGRMSKIKVVSIDGSDEGKGFIRSGEMVASAAQDPAKIGSTCIDVAYKVLAGQSVDAKVVVPMSIIDKTNVDKASSGATSAAASSAAVSSK